MYDIGYRDINEALPNLARHLLQGTVLPSRNGDVLELRNVHITLREPLRREVVHPERAASLPAQIAETAWVLAGRNDIGWLSHYLPRAADFSDDGNRWRAGYGPRMRNFGAESDAEGVGVDQLAFVIDELTRDPDSRRAVISLWDPQVDTTPGKDIACNNWLHFLVRDGAVHLHVATRSNDFVWGWSGINAFEWSVLLEVVASCIGAAVGEIYFSVSSFHVYQPYWGKNDRISRSGPRTGPRKDTARLEAKSLTRLDAQLEAFFLAEEQARTSHGRMTVEASRAVTDPMLAEWLQVLAWWWGDDSVELQGRTKIAAELSPNRPKQEPLPDAGGSAVPDRSLDAFKKFVTALHSEKHRAYGDSWKKRGESFSIIPNIARKVDRLAVGGETRDETSADTAIDLLCYAAKYHAWLDDRDTFVEGSHASDGDAVPNRMIQSMDQSSRYTWNSEADLARLAGERFDELVALVEEPAHAWQRREKVFQLQQIAFELAYRLWSRA